MFEAISKIIIFSVLGVACSFIYAWMFSVIWAWFAVPAGLVALPYAAFLAVTFLISIAGIMTTPIRKSDLEDKGHDISMVVGVAITKIIVALSILGLAGLVFLLL